MTKKENDQLVLEIHADFDNASDVLLNEAKRIIQEDAIAERLKRLGFNKIPMVKDRDDLRAKKRLVETVEYYQQKYPMYKFITANDAEKLCKKHKLNLGDVATYIGEIPDKNINEILNFTILAEDKPLLDSGMWSSFGGSDKFEKQFLVEGKWCEESGEENHRNKMNFRICAPAHLFDMTRNSIADGYKIVLDPIVLQPVNGGYLIVTKWGLEANDESITNPTDN